MLRAVAALAYVSQRYTTPPRPARPHFSPRALLRVPAYFPHRHRRRAQVHVGASASSGSPDGGGKMEFLDEADFDALKDAMSLYDEQRDTVIKRSRDITKASKVAIYCLHRGEMVGGCAAWPWALAPPAVCAG